jgi:hypothetical protein
MTPDTGIFLVMSRLLNGESISINEIIITFIIIIIVNIIRSLTDSGRIITTITNFFENKVLGYRQSVTIIGFETIHANGFFYDYPYSMLALNHLFVTEYNVPNYILANLKNNGIYYSDDLEDPNNKDDFDNCYILNDMDYIKLDNDLYITMIRNKTTVGKQHHNSTSDSQASQVKLVLYSNTIDLNKIINKALKKYTEYCNKKNNNNIYHFIYQGGAGKHAFTKHLLSKKDHSKLNEGFDHLFNEHTKTFIRDVDKLKNKAYYYKYGLKRKKGYLFYGHPGCGKTSTVTAMALYDNRHIIEVPFTRIKTSKDFEDLINLDHVDDVKFNKDEIILLFDEIDINNKILTRNNDSASDITAIIKALGLANKTNDNQKVSIKDDPADIDTPVVVSNNTSSDGDSINLGTILSRLDGIGNYDGLIMIATTNHLDKLDPAIYREMRLTPYYFDYLRKSDIINMLETYFEIKLSEDQIDQLPDRKDKITPAKLRHIIQDVFQDNTDNKSAIVNKFVTDLNELINR